MKADTRQIKVRAAVLDKLKRVQDKIGYKYEWQDLNQVSLSETIDFLIDLRTVITDGMGAEIRWRPGLIEDKIVVRFPTPVDEPEASP